jgi:hypothetical protein
MYLFFLIPSPTTLQTWAQYTLYRINMTISHTVQHSSARPLLNITLRVSLLVFFSSTLSFFSRLSVFVYSATLLLYPLFSFSLFPPSSSSFYSYLPTCLFVTFIFNSSLRFYSFHPISFSYFCVRFWQSPKSIRDSCSWIPHVATCALSKFHFVLEHSAAFSWHVLPYLPVTTALYTPRFAICCRRLKQHNARADLPARKWRRKSSNTAIT